MPRVIVTLLTVIAAFTCRVSPAEARITPAKIQLSAMDHVAINVADLQRSADWYAKVLGFSIFHKWQTTWMIRRGPMRLGLFLRPNAAKIADLDHTYAITHFAYSLSKLSLTAAMAQLRAMNIPFEGPEDTGVADSIFLHDPDGYEVELTSYH